MLFYDSGRALTTGSTAVPKYRNRVFATGTVAAAAGIILLILKYLFFPCYTFPPLFAEIRFCQFRRSCTRVNMTLYCSTKPVYKMHACSAYVQYVLIVYAIEHIQESAAIVDKINFAQRRCCRSPCLFRLELINTRALRFPRFKIIAFIPFSVRNDIETR